MVFRGVLMHLLWFFPLMLSAKPLADNPMRPSCLEAMLPPNSFHDLSPLLEALGIDLTTVKTEKSVVLADPLKAFERHFVRRSINVDGLQVVISNFENNIGFSEDVVAMAKKEGIWPKDAAGADLSLPEDQISLMRVMQAKSAIIGLPLEQLLRLQEIAEAVEQKGLAIAHDTNAAISAFALENELRRGWTEGLYSHLRGTSPKFIGSTTNIEIRDAAGDLIGTTSFVRAPFGGHTLVSFVDGKQVVDTSYGSWGPHYKRLAAVDPHTIFIPDHVLHARAMAAETFLGGLLHPIMLFETYVPRGIVPNREMFQGSIYDARASKDGKSFEFWWQHELIEPRMFAFSRAHSLRGRAMVTMMILAFLFVLDPFSGTSIEDVPHRTFLFPNDLLGVALYAKFGFRPQGEGFEVFGMKDWFLLMASSQSFHDALVEIIRKLKSGESTLDEMFHLAEDFYSRK